MPKRSNKGSICLQNKDIRKMQIRRRLSGELQILEEKQKKRLEEQEQLQAALRESMQRTEENENQIRAAIESRDVEKLNFYEEVRDDVVNISDNDNCHKEELECEQDNALYSSASEHALETEITKLEEEQNEAVEELCNREIEPEIIVLESMSLVTSEQSCKSFSKESSQVSSILDVSDSNSNSDSNKIADGEEQVTPDILLNQGEDVDYTNTADATENAAEVSNTENEIFKIDNNDNVNENAEAISALSVSDGEKESVASDIHSETIEEEQLEELQKKENAVEFRGNEDEITHDKENIDMINEENTFEHTYEEEDREEEEEEKEYEERVEKERNDINVEELIEDHNRNDDEKEQKVNNDFSELITDEEVVSDNAMIVVTPMPTIKIKEEQLFIRLVEKEQYQQQEAIKDDAAVADHRECVQIDKSTSPDFIMSHRSQYTQSAPKRHCVNSAQVRASNKASANMNSISRPLRPSTTQGRSKLSYLRAWRGWHSQENVSLIDLVDTPQHDDHESTANNKNDDRVADTDINNTGDNVNMDYFVRNETSPYEELNYDIDLTDKKTNDKENGKNNDESNKEINLPTASQVALLSLRQRNELKMKLKHLLDQIDFTKALHKYKRLEIDGVHYKAARELFHIISHNKSIILPEDMYTLLYLFTAVGARLQEAYAYYDENHFHRSGLSFNDFVLHIETLVERLYAYDKFYALSDNDHRINAVWNRFNHVENGTDETVLCKDNVEGILQQLCNRLNEQEVNHLLLEYNDLKGVSKESTSKTNNETDNNTNRSNVVNEFYSKYNYTHFFVFRRYEQLFIRAQEENYTKIDASTNEELKVSTTSAHDANAIDEAPHVTADNSSTSLPPLTAVNVSQQCTRVVETPVRDDNCHLIVESVETNWWGESDNEINIANNSDSVCKDDDEDHDNKDDDEDKHDEHDDEEDHHNRDNEEDKKQHDEGNNNDESDDNDESDNPDMYKVNIENFDTEDNEDDEDYMFMNNINDAIHRHSEITNLDEATDGYERKQFHQNVNALTKFEAYETNWWEKEDGNDTADLDRGSPEPADSKLSSTPLIDESTKDASTDEPNASIINEELCEEQCTMPSAVDNKNISEIPCAANIEQESNKKWLIPSAPQKSCEPLLPSIRKKVRRRRIKTSAVSTKHIVSPTTNNEEQFLVSSLPNDHEFTATKSKEDRLPRLAKSAAQTRAIHHYSNLYGYGKRSEYDDDDDIIRKLRTAYSTYNRLTKY